MADGGLEAMEQPHFSMIRRYLSHPKLALISGSLLLLFSLIMLRAWLQFFFIFAVEVPVNGIGISNLCRWQYSLSEDLNNEMQYVPFLIIFHLSALLFIFRLRAREQRTLLPLEFGIVNILFVAAGMGVFILAVLINIVVFLIVPASSSWMMSLLACEPTFPFWPGVIATALMAGGLLCSQASGWLMKKFFRPSPAVPPEDSKEIKKEATNKNLILGGGILLLLVALVLLHSWLVLFFTYAVQLPETAMWVCWGTGCEMTVWQSDFSHYFAWVPGARIKPFLLVFHLALFIAFFRFRQKEARLYLPLEFGTLGILFMLIGMLVFAGAIAGYKTVNPPRQADTIISVTELENGAVLTMYAPSPRGFVSKDGSGFIVMSPDSDLHYIFSRVPWEVNGKLRAWSGVAASTIMALGLLLSMASGWLNRLIRRIAPARQAGLLFLTLLVSGIVLFMELRTFGFYLFR